MKTVDISFEHLKNYVADVCRQIVNDGWKPDMVVGITRGGALPAVMISHYFNVPMHPLKISLRDDEESVSDCGLSEDAFGYVFKGEAVNGFNQNWCETRQKNILVVDDINDSGATIDWLINDWQSSCLPDSPRWKDVWNKNVRFATIIDNLSSKCQVKIDYTAMVVNKEEYHIWYNFPYENWWRTS
jgi:hypoxanthine phosphoribosyltransferase